MEDNPGRPAEITCAICGISVRVDRRGKVPTFCGGHNRTVLVHSVRAEHVLDAIAGGRLRVNVETGTVETRRANPKAVWRVSKPERVLAPHQKLPYLRCSFTNDGVTYKCLVHRAVWFAAGRGNLDQGREINHVDGDKTNNGIHNLEAVTAGENTKHAWELGLNRSNPFTVSKGRCRRGTPITPELLREIRESEEPGIVIATRLGMANDTISRVRLRRSFSKVE